jgi:hypothetical protein
MATLKLNKGKNAQYLFSSVNPTDGTTAVALTGCTKAQFNLLKQDGSGYALQLDSVAKPLQVIIDTTAGTVTVKVLAADSAAFQLGTAQYDVQLTFSDGTLLPLIAKDFIDVIADAVDTITVPATPLHLEDITVQMVKDYYNLGATDTAHDKQIAMIIPAALAIVRVETRRDWKLKSVVESNNALGPMPSVGYNVAIPIPAGAEVNESPRTMAWQASFFTKYRPVSNVVIYEDTQLRTENVDYIVFHKTGEIRKLINYMFAIYPTYGNNFYYVNYSYWNSFPGKIQISYDTGEAPPADLIYCALEIIGIRAGLKTRTYVNNEGVSQSVLMTEIPKEIYRQLRLHRKVRV